MKASFGRDIFSRYYIAVKFILASKQRDTWFCLLAFVNEML